MPSARRTSVSTQKIDFTAGTDSYPNDPHVEAEARVRQAAVPPAARTLGTLPHIDDEDAFLVEVGPAQDRTGDRWGWLALGLRLGSAGSDRLVLGWEVRRSTPNVALLAASSRLGLPAELLFKRQQQALLVATFAQQENHIARAVWAAVASGHRRVVRYLLERASRSLREQE
jgi:hypothetical protein